MDTATTHIRPRVIHALPLGSVVQVFAKSTDTDGVSHTQVDTIECVSPEQAVAIARFYEAIG